MFFFNLFSLIFKLQYMAIQREKFKSPVAVACYILIASMAVGAVLGVFAVVPALKNKCLWFTGNCQQITYQVAPNGTLLVINPATSFMYWYDGQYIYSYGNVVPGACTSALSTGTRTLVPQGQPVPNACLKWSKDSSGKTFCSLPSSQTSNPSVFDGVPVATGDAFEPVFVVNAYSMQVLPQKTACALSRTVVQNMFKGVPSSSMTYSVPPDGNPLDVYQLFGLLQERGVFVPPSSDTIWYNTSSEQQQ
jgi:hypothetical protein